MEDKQREISNVLKLIDKIINDIENIESSINANYEHITTTILTGNDLCLIKDNIIYLEHRISELMEEKEDWSKRLDAHKMELVEQAREVKKLETLKSKALYTIKKTQNRKEQKILDEIALQKINK